MHTYIGMILTPEADTEKTLDKAERLLAKFDLNAKVPEHKSYLDDKDVALMKDHYGLSEPDSLAEKLEEWIGEPGGLDEKGLYVTTTHNPDGHFDDWQLFGPSALEPNIFTNSDVYCEAIIMDDGVWQPTPSVYGLPPEEQNRLMDEWEAKLAAIIEANQDKVAVGVRCHK